MILFWLCLAWMAGIALAPLTGFPLETFLPAGALSILLAAAAPRRFRMTLCVLAIGFLGGARWLLAQPVPGESFVGSYGHQFATLDLLLEEDGQSNGNGIRFRARAERLRTGEDGEWIALEGLVIVDFRARPEGWMPRYGDRVRVRGVIQPPPVVEDFDYAAYLARQGVFAVLSDPEVESVTPDRGNPALGALAAFRRRALATIRTLFPEPEGSLLAGILLGDDSGIPDEVQTAFSRTGTSHIVAISGFNISIVAAIFLSLTGRIPRRMHGWLLAAAGIFVYTILVGASASVVRAAVMGFLALVARQIGRQSHGLTSLAFSGAAMTVWNPETLWDIGFQLSFAATLGLILFADPLQTGVQRMLQQVMTAKQAKPLAGLAGEVFLLTFAAQITTLPLLLLYFHSLSVGALVINPLVLSVQPLVMIAGGLAVLLGMVWLPAGQALGWLGWAPTAYTIRVVQFGASFPAGWWPVGDVPAWRIGAFYAGLFGLIGWIQPGRGKVFQWGRTIITRALSVAIPILAALAFVAWTAAFQQADGRLHLVAVQAGRGELVLVRSPSGGTVLIHAGGDPNAVLAALGGELGIGNRRLDWVVLTSPEKTDAALWEELGVRYEFGAVAYPAETEAGSGVLGDILARCRSEKVPVFPVGQGERLDLGDGAGLVFLAGGDGQLVIAVEERNSRWVIPVGLEGDLAGRLIAAGRVPAAQILFPVNVGADWNAAVWLARVNPLAAVSLRGEESGWMEGRLPLRVSTFGRIDFATDGAQLWTQAL
jgi:competence protein ComEC